jgi:hypothetical protein
MRYGIWRTTNIRFSIYGDSRWSAAAGDTAGKLRLPDYETLFRSDRKMQEKKIEGAKDPYIFLSHIFLSDRKTSRGENRVCRQYRLEPLW